MLLKAGGAFSWLPAAVIVADLAALATAWVLLIELALTNRAR